MPDHALSHNSAEYNVITIVKKKQELPLSSSHPVVFSCKVLNPILDAFLRFLVLISIPVPCEVLKPIPDRIISVRSDFIGISEKEYKNIFISQ